MSRNKLLPDDETSPIVRHIWKQASCDKTLHVFLGIFVESMIDDKAVTDPDSDAPVFNVATELVASMFGCVAAYHVFRWTKNYWNRKDANDKLDLLTRETEFVNQLVKECNLDRQKAMNYVNKTLLRIGSQEDDMLSKIKLGFCKIGFQLTDEYNNVY